MNPTLKALIKKEGIELGSTLLRGKGGKGGKANKNASSSVGKTVLLVILVLYVVAVFGFIFFMMSGLLCPPLVDANLTWVYFVLMGSVATAFGVIGSVFSTYASIYEAKDNDLLLSMPIPPRYILFSKMAVLYILCFAFEALIMLPAGIVYFLTVSSLIGGGAMALAVVFFILLLLVLPLLALSLSCVLAFLLGLLLSRIGDRAKNTIYTLFSVAFIVAYFFIYSKSNEYLTMILADPTGLGNKLKFIAYPIYLMGRGMEGSIISELLFLIIAIGLFIAIYALLSRSYIKLATSKRGSAKIAYRARREKRTSVFSALLSKERARFFSCTVYMLNCGLGCALLIVAAVALFVKMWDIRLMLSQIEPLRRYLPLLACLALAFINAMPQTTTPSVSLEGNSIWLLQSLPVPAYKVLGAKLVWNLILALPTTLICSVSVAIVAQTSIIDAIAMALVSLAFALFSAMLGLVINLLLPSLEWTNEAVPVKQSGAVFVHMLLGMVSISIFTVPYIFLALFVSPTIYMFICTGLLCAISAGLWAWLKSGGSKRFDRL